MLQARRREKDFILKNSANEQTKHAVHMEKLYTVTDDLQEHALTPKQVQLARDIKSAATEYDSAFNAMVSNKIKLGLSEK